MHTDIALGNGAEQCVGQRCNPTRIAMAGSFFRCGIGTPHKITASPAPNACTS